MKKTFISASIASVLAMASASALAAGPDFYGRLDLAVTNASNGATLQGTTSNIDMQNGGTYFENNFSYLGVKGSENIAAGFDVIYQMEFGVENTGVDGAKKPFTSRNTFLGLKTQAGTVLVGRNDTVFKQAEGGVDIFGNTNADIDRLVAAQTRSADGIWYYSPKLGDLVTVNATYLMEDNQADRTHADKTPDSSAMYAISATAGDKKLKAQNFYAAVAYNTGISGIEAYRAVGQVKLADFKLGGLYQHSKSQSMNDVKGDSYFVNVVYNLNGVNLKAEYGYDDSGLGAYAAKLIKNNLAAEKDFKVNQYTLGADYRLAKSTLIYGHYALYEGSYHNGANKVDLKDDNVFTVGVRYDF